MWTMGTTKTVFSTSQVGVMLHYSCCIHDMSLIMVLINSDKWSIKQAESDHAEMDPKKTHNKQCQSIDVALFGSDDWANFKLSSSKSFIANVKVLTYVRGLFQTNVCIYLVNKSCRLADVKFSDFISPV